MVEAPQLNVTGLPRVRALSAGCSRLVTDNCCNTCSLPSRPTFSLPLKFLNYITIRLFSRQLQTVGQPPFAPSRFHDRRHAFLSVCLSRSTRSELIRSSPTIPSRCNISQRDVTHAMRGSTELQRNSTRACSPRPLPGAVAGSNTRNAVPLRDAFYSSSTESASDRASPSPPTGRRPRRPAAFAVWLRSGQRKDRST